ncbi:MAG: carboxypeptidase-like regulatory domain-containing protein [Cyclobacteriaceae bacterium]
MSLYRKLFIVSVGLNLSFCLTANGQKVVTGIVVDSTDFAPLPYVNIQIKHTFRGTITNASGQFKIAAQLSDTLVLSYIGYHTVELPLWCKL